MSKLKLRKGRIQLRSVDQAPIFVFKYNNLFLQKHLMQTNQRQYELKMKNYMTSKHYGEVQHLEAGLINEFKRFRFDADIGQYFQITFMPNLHVRRVTHHEVGKILQIKDPKKQLEKTISIVTQEFNCVKNISNKIDEYLQNSRNLNSSMEFNVYKNIKMNRFLQYNYLKCDPALGFFLFHEPIIITLEQVIKKNILEYSQKIELMAEILNIMEFLQELRICHRNITSFAFVFVNKNSNDEIKSFNKNWKYDKKCYELKITSFYQAVSADSKQSQANHNIVFDNAYVDPNITSFKKPQYSSDLWSVVILFYEIMVGKLPPLDNKALLESQMASMLGWQKEFFNYFFRGTKEVNIGLKDLQMRVKNMSITSSLTSKIILHKQQDEPDRMWRSLKESGFSNKTSRRRAYSEFIPN